MATLLELYNRASDDELRVRVTAACWNEAKAIFLEDVGTPLHAERLMWAVAALRERQAEGVIAPVRIAVAVLLQDIAEPTDAQVQTAVSVVVNRFAE